VARRRRQARQGQSEERRGELAGEGEVEGRQHKKRVPAEGESLRGKGRARRGAISRKRGQAEEERGEDKQRE
jgi:hypothetical protein